MSRLALVCALVALSLPAFADDWPQFRGPARDGISPETGLLKAWPEEGPKVVWKASGLAVGWTSPVIVGDKLYTTGMKGTDLVLFAVDTKTGKQLYTKPIGPAWVARKAYQGSRGTPTFHDGHLYVITGLGLVACHKAETGEQVWKVDMLKRFGGKNTAWGIAEAPLIEGGRMICTPGGPDATIAALDLATGATVWQSKGLSDGAGYCSPVVITHGGQRQIITWAATAVVSVDAASGAKLWRHEMANRFKCHPNSPVVKDGHIYLCSAIAGVSVLKLGDDGKSVTKAWATKDGDTQMGGAVVIGDHVYASAMRRPKDTWMCYGLKDGKLAYQAKGVGSGVVISAEGMLYCYGTNGELALVKATPEGYQQTGKVMIKDGSGEHWAHPAIAGGRLYVRRGSVIVCYDIKAPAK